MKKIYINYRLWSFNKCENFVIIPGIVTDYKTNCRVKITDDSVFGDRSQKAIVKSVHHCRFCDIESFKHWHLYRTLKSNNCIKSLNGDCPVEMETYQLRQCALTTIKMSNPTFIEKEIVTLIYFDMDSRTIGDDTIVQYGTFDEIIKSSNKD